MLTGESVDKNLSKSPSNNDKLLKLKIQLQFGRIFHNENIVLYGLKKIGSDYNFLMTMYYKLAYFHSKNKLLEGKVFTLFYCY